MRTTEETRDRANRLRACLTALVNRSRNEPLWEALDSAHTALLWVLEAETPPGWPNNLTMANVKRQKREAT